MAERWEYKVVSYLARKGDLEDELNKLGELRWELVHIRRYPSWEHGYEGVFKRPLNS